MNVIAWFELQRMYVIRVSRGLQFTVLFILWPVRRFVLIHRNHFRQWSTMIFVFFFTFETNRVYTYVFHFFFPSFLSLFFLFSLWLSLPGENFRRLNDFYLTIKFQYIVLIIFFFFFISFSFIQLFISAVTSRTVFYSIKSKFQFKIREFIQRITSRYSR